MVSDGNDHSHAVVAAPKAWVTRRLLLVAGATFLVGIIGGLLALRDPIAPLTSDHLAEARARWKASGIGFYQVTYSLNRDQYDVVCGGGIVRSVTVNGQPPRSSDWRLYSLDGLFDILAMDLDSLDDPYGPFAGASQTIFLRARFHPEWGYVEKYVRSSVGPVKGAAIHVTSFAVTEDRPAGP